MTQTKKSGFALISVMITLLVGTFILVGAIQSLKTYSNITRLNINKTRAYYNASTGANITIGTIRDALASSTQIPSELEYPNFDSTIEIVSQLNNNVIYHIVSTGTSNGSRSTVETFYSVSLPPLVAPSPTPTPSVTPTPDPVNPTPVPTVTPELPNDGSVLPAHCLNGHGADDHNENPCPTSVPSGKKKK